MRVIKAGSIIPTPLFLGVLQGFPEPIGVVAPVPEQPVDIWQTAQQGPRPDVIAHLPGRHEEVERPPFAVADGMQLGVHAALGAANQAATPPFFTPRLDAVRCALRYLRRLTRTHGVRLFTSIITVFFSPCYRVLKKS